MIEDSTKEQIAAELGKYVANIGSQVKAGNALGVSNAYISQIISGKYHAVSDDMWQKLSKLLNMRIEEQWNHADTKPALKMTAYLDDSRIHGNVFGIVCTPGSGKTDLLDYYSKKHRNVFYVKCERHMPERVMLRNLLKTMGITAAARDGITALLEQIKEETFKRSNPVIIIDEMEKTKNDVFFLFIDMYNLLWKKCGIILLGTPNLSRRIIDGNRRGTLGFNEILSRLGGKLIAIPLPDASDAALVVRANGITDPATVASIVNNSEVDRHIDMRRVERLVHAEKQKQANAA